MVLQFLAEWSRSSVVLLLSWASDTCVRRPSPVSSIVTVWWFSGASGRPDSGLQCE